MFVYFNFLNYNESLIYTLIIVIIHHLIKMTKRKNIILMIIKFLHTSWIFWTSIYVGWW